MCASSPRYKDNKFARTTLHRSLDSIETESAYLFLGTSFAEEAERIPPGEEGSHSEERPCSSNEQKDDILHCRQTHSQGRPCANPTEVQPPRVQRKQARIDHATIPVKAAHTGPPVMPMKERLWFSIQASQKYDHSLKPLSKRTQIILCSTRTSSSRKEWSSTLAPIDAMSG